MKQQRTAVYILSATVLLTHGLQGAEPATWVASALVLFALVLLSFILRTLWMQEEKSSLALGLASLALVYAFSSPLSAVHPSLSYALVYGLMGALAVLLDMKTVLLVLLAALVTEGLSYSMQAIDGSTASVHVGLMVFFALSFGFLLRGRALLLKRQQKLQIKDKLQQLEQDARDFRLAESLRPGSQLPQSFESGPASEWQSHPPMNSKHQRLLGSVRAIRDALHDVLELARLSVDADTVLYFSYDDKLGELKLKATVPEDQSPSSIERPISAREGALAAVIKTAAPIRMLPKEAGRYLGHPSQREALAFLGVPMSEEGVIRGVLVANRFEADEFVENDEKRFEAIAREVLRAVESERIFANMDRMRQEQERFFEAFALLNDALKLDDAATKLLEAVDCIKTLDFLAVTAYQVESGTHRILRLRSSAHKSSDWEGREFKNSDGGLVAMAIKNGRPLPYAPLTEQTMTGPLQIFGKNGNIDLKSVKVFPMADHNQAVGALVVGSRDAEKELSKAEVRMLKTVSTHAAITLSNAEMYRKMEMMATTDGLTGLATRRRFLELVSEAIARAERFGGRVSLLMVDADHFKSINDTYGHPVGDIVLQKISKILSEEARRVDVVGRYGGEEFIAMLAETNMAGALQVAERMRQQIAELVIQGEFGRVQVTVSMGLATYPDHGANVEKLLKAADQALYAAKENGRNQVRVAGEAHCASPQDPVKEKAEGRIET